MQFLILAFDSSTAPAAFRRRNSGRVRPARPAAPACRKLRRVDAAADGDLDVADVQAWGSPWRAIRVQRSKAAVS